MSTELLALNVIRLALGIVMILAGYRKLWGARKKAEESYRRMGENRMWLLTLAGWIELVCGVLIVFNLFTTVCSFILMLIMLKYLYTQLNPKTNTGDSNYAILLVASCLVVFLSATF